MRKRFKRHLTIVFPGIFLLLFSCTPESCYEDTISLVKISFYDYDTGNLVSPDSLTIFGLGMESAKIYNKTKKVQPALLPLNAAAESSIFIIRINGVNDTVQFSYSSYPHLVSKECGYTYYHTLDTNRHFTRNAIINIYYTNRIITTSNEENIMLYY